MVRFAARKLQARAGRPYAARRTSRRSRQLLSGVEAKRFLSCLFFFQRFVELSLKTSHETQKKLENAHLK